MAKILIVEPSEEIAELLSVIVRRLGHEPAVHVTGRELPDADAALVEPAYPWTLELAETLRKREAALPIVCLSIYPASEAVLALEPAAYLLKPFTLGELEAAIADALAGRRGAPRRPVRV